MTASKQVKVPQPPEGGERWRGNADWQSAQYKESNGGKNATEGNKEDGREDGGAVPDSIGRNRRKGRAEPCPIQSGAIEESQ